MRKLAGNILLRSDSPGIQNKKIKFTIIRAFLHSHCEEYFLLIYFECLKIDKKKYGILFSVPIPPGNIREKVTSTIHEPSPIVTPNKIPHFLTQANQNNKKLNLKLTFSYGIIWSKEYRNMNDKIIIKGANQHNLRNVDLELPKNELIVFTGVSGSGKSSLAFDTIFAEGQRRDVESLSTYARQFLGQMDKPDVESIEGLSPAISIDQKSTSNNPRSTVGTVTEIYDYLRLLFARIGVPHCPECGDPIKPAINRRNCLTE